MRKVATILNNEDKTSEIFIDNDNSIIVDDDKLDYKFETFDEAVDGIYCLWGNPVWRLEVLEDEIYKK